MRFIITILLFVTSLSATAIQIPTLSPSPYSDCEASTNIALAASMKNRFEISITVDSAANNGVELAFGCDDDGDGVLSRTETDMTIGCHGGEWKVTDCTSDSGTLMLQSSDGAQVLNWTLRLAFDTLNPRRLVATVNGESVLTSWQSNAPNFLFNPEWDTARLTAYRQDGVPPSVAIDRTQPPLVIRIR